MRCALSWRALLLWWLVAALCVFCGVVLAEGPAAETSLDDLLEQVEGSLAAVTSGFDAGTVGEAVEHFESRLSGQLRRAVERADASASDPLAKLPELDALPRRPAIPLRAVCVRRENGSDHDEQRSRPLERPSSRGGRTASGWR